MIPNLISIWDGWLVLGFYNLGASITL